MKICIGIISYLPSDMSSREVRINRLQSLLKQLNDHFKLPIIIVAQNWNEFRVIQGNIAVFKYDKLGITRARATLRYHFLESTYDYMIMLDDDMELSDNQADYDYYINIVETTKREYYYVRNFLNNFSCISKDGFKKVDYDMSIDPEQGTGYEDWVFNEKCKATLDCMSIESALPKFDRSHFLDDRYSTWNVGDIYIKKSNEAISLGIIKKLRGSKIANDSTFWF